MEGFFEQINNKPELPEVESVETLPVAEYTFCNNGKVLEVFLAPNYEDDLPARTIFFERTGREFGSKDGDSFTKTNTKDTLSAS